MRKACRFRSCCSSAMRPPAISTWQDPYDFSDNGSVAFERAMIDPEETRPFDINTMDVNGDGKKDVLTSAFKQSKIYWYEAPAEDNASWTQHLVSDTFDGTDVFTGDINNDGTEEFVIARLRQSKLSWFEYDRADQTWTEHLIDYTLLPADVSLNDLDGDGDLDVVLAGLGANQVIWYENKLNENQNCVLTFMLGKDSPRLALLRDFRDNIVMAIPGGNRLIDAYYYFSPGLIKCMQLFLAYAR